MKRLLYKGEPVLTFKMIDELHGKAGDSSKMAFHRYKEHFEEGKHYFSISAGTMPSNECSLVTQVTDCDLPIREQLGVNRSETVPSDESSLDAEVTDRYLPTREQMDVDYVFDESIDISEDGLSRKKTTILTMHGYLLIVKTFTDDRSWKIQTKLVDFYFEMHARPMLVYDKEIETLKITYEAENKRLRHELFLQYRAMQDRVGPCIDGLKERLSKYEPVDRKFMPLDEAWQTFGQGMKRKHFMRIITKYKIPTRIREDIDGNKVKDLFIHGLETAISNFIAQCKPHCKEPGIYIHPLMREPFVLR